MRKFILMFAMLLSSVAIFAQDAVVTDPDGSEFAIDLGTFTGIVALISYLVTQIAKLLPKVATSKLAKIGMSCGVGIVVCIVAWVLNLSPMLSGFAWWAALIYGVAAGLSGCGFYDVVKAVGALFKKNQSEPK